MLVVARTLLPQAFNKITAEVGVEDNLSISEDAVYRRSTSERSNRRSPPSWVRACALDITGDRVDSIGPKPDIYSVGSPLGSEDTTIIVVEVVTIREIITSVVVGGTASRLAGCRLLRSSSRVADDIEGSSTLTSEQGYQNRRSDLREHGHSIDDRVVDTGDCSDLALSTPKKVYPYQHIIRDLDPSNSHPGTVPQVPPGMLAISATKRPWLKVCFEINFVAPRPASPGATSYILSTPI